MEQRTPIKELRDAANHADSRAAYSEDMAAAARCEDEADELAHRQDRPERKPSGFPPADKDIHRPFGLPYPSGQKK